MANRQKHKKKNGKHEVDEASGKNEEKRRER